MKVTKYPQSCLLLEKEGRRLVIDPGMFFAKQYTADDLGGVEAVLYTHEHPDHYNPEVAEALRAKGTKLFANASTAKLVGECTVVNDGDEFEIAGFKVSAHELPHCLLPSGKEGPQNTGYLIDGVFFDPGDGKELEGLKAESMALPITGPDISMLDAFTFAKQLGVKVAIPVHYNWIKVDPQSYKEFAQFAEMPFELRVLADGESTEV
jgi:L-ascorbate metabolism protein UlaG (beta-lactamase superfamily)